METKDRASGELLYGLNGGRLLYIEEAANGLSCACICPYCRGPLVARQGAIVGHHFAHANDIDCGHASETVLHLAAKELLSSSSYIVLPPVWADVPQLNVNPPETWETRVPRHSRPILLRKESKYIIDSAALEHRIGSIVVDVILYIKGKPLLVEIVVSHGIDEHKYAEIRRLGISALAIILTDMPRHGNPVELLTADVIESSPRKRWIWNAFAASQPKQRQVTRKGYSLHTDHCPIFAREVFGRPYANALNDCSRCNYLTGWEVNDKQLAIGLDAPSRYVLYEAPPIPAGHLHCVGDLAGPLLRSPTY